MMIKCGDSSMLEQQTLQFADGGSIPTSPHQLKIRKGEYREFSHLLRKYHYKEDKIGGSISYHLVLSFEGRIYGGAVLGTMRHKDNYSGNAIEIRRMVLHPERPENTASYFLSKIIWWLKKNTDVKEIYTFADQTVGHEGTCYKAANFKKVKETPPSKHVMWRGRRYHPRSLTIDRPYSYEMRKDLKDGVAKIETGKPKILYRYQI